MGFQMVYSLSSPGDEPSRVPMSLIVGSSTVADACGKGAGGELVFFSGRRTAVLDDLASIQ